MRNTKINIVSFAVSTAIRLMVTNVVFFLFGAEALGELTSLLALNALAMASASVIEIDIAKGRYGLNIISAIIIAANVIVVGCALFFYASDRALHEVLFVICLWILINTNLVLSGLYFVNDCFYNYRLLCIRAELLEAITFISLILAARDAFVAVFLSLFVKNIVLLFQSLVGARSFDLFSRRDKACDKRASWDSFSSINDVAGNVAVQGALPLAMISACGTAIFGFFVFFKQFFSVGSMLQAAVFRGMWRDSRSGTLPTFVTLAFKQANYWISIIVMMIGIIFFAPEPMDVFVGTGVLLGYITIARSAVLLSGHMADQKTVNGEIVLLLSFFVVSNYTGVNDNFIFLSLVSVAVAGLITISANYVLRSVKLQ